MTFICQIVLTPDLFGPVVARMAYVFMTDTDDIVETWDPDEGENAVILQPGSPSVPTQPLLTGPSIYRMAAQPDESLLVPVPSEYEVQFHAGEDPEFVAPEWEGGPPADESLPAPFAGNKIGG